MTNIPTQKENPKGLHQRYYIQKIVPASPEFIDRSRFIHETVIPLNLNDIGKPFKEPKVMLQDCDKDAEYFVMRLDTGGSDLKHIAACRVGIHAYADAIYPHLPELAIDLKTRYPLL